MIGIWGTLLITLLSNAACLMALFISVLKHESRIAIAWALFIVFDDSLAAYRYDHPRLLLPAAIMGLVLGAAVSVRKNSPVDAKTPTLVSDGSVDPLTTPSVQLAPQR